MKRRGLSSRSGIRTTCAVLCVLLASGRSAFAQEAGPIGPFVVDARGTAAFVGQNGPIAAARGLTAPQLPSRTLGFDVAAHVYPFRWKAVTFGIGAALTMTRGRQGAAVDDSEEVTGETVETRFNALSPQLSFNFGDGDGWSYISGGLGSSRFAVDTESGPPDEPPRAKTINYGGGARWFVKDHMAVTFDLRFYAITPVVADLDTPGAPRMTVTVLSIGVSFK